MALPNNFSEDLDRAIEVAARLGPEIALRPGVVAVGAGMERREGKPTARAAIVITVRQKLTAEQLASRGLEPLPDQLEGIPVDIVQFEAPLENPETRRQFEQAIRVRDRVTAEWLRENNVTGVGVGYKIKSGALTEVVSVQIFVENKLPPEQVKARGLRLVPPEIDGVPSDVIQLSKPREHVPPSGIRGDRRDPLVGGLSIGHATAPFHFGTLAAVVFDAGNQALGLSNEHVLDGDIGETVHQPSPVGLDDSFEVDVQLDVCIPINFIRIDTPDTLGGSILAGAAAAAAAAAALSDEIDPTREGQENTPPPAGVFTREEYTKAKIKYPLFPLPGTPFKLTAATHYERRTDGGTLMHDVTHDRQNPHVLDYHRLFVNRLLYGTSDTIRLFGVAIEQAGQPNEPVFKPRNCRMHCLGLLHPVRLDRSYPVVLRSVNELPSGPKLRSEFFDLLFSGAFSVTPEELQLLRRNLDVLCLYYAEYSTAGLPVGKWIHWMFVQTMNTVAPGTDPLKAAQIIGGLPLSQNIKPQIDVACGPFVFEDDGSFDIEPLSI